MGGVSEGALGEELEGRIVEMQAGNKLGMLSVRGCASRVLRAG